MHGASRLAELESRIGLALVKRQPTGYRIQRRGRPRSIAALANHAMIGFDGIMQGDRAATWLAQAVPSARIVNRNNSILGTLSAARAGIGVAALPTTLGDAEETPVQVLPPVDELVPPHPSRPAQDAAHRRLRRSRARGHPGAAEGVDRLA